MRDLETAWNHPATFALEANLRRHADALAGPRVHARRGLDGRTAGASLAARGARSDGGAAVDGRRPTGRARTLGLVAARRGTEDTLRAAPWPEHRTSGLPVEEPLPLWWRSTLQKAQWAAGRCLEALAEPWRARAADGETGIWLSQDRRFHADVGTASGPLRLHAQCDLVFSDQPGLAGASCQMIDIRTGAAPPAGTHMPPDRLEKGRGIEPGGSLMFLAVARNPKGSAGGRPPGCQPVPSIPGRGQHWCSPLTAAVSEAWLTPEPGLVLRTPRRPAARPPLRPARQSRLRRQGPARALSLGLRRCPARRRWTSIPPCWRAKSSPRVHPAGITARRLSLTPSRRMR